MSMDVWMPEPCATDAETVADTEVEKVICIVIGSAKMGPVSCGASDLSSPGTLLKSPRQRTSPVW